MTPLYIALEGNIGAGKTTIAQKLAEKLGAKLVLEEFVDNPFLKLFYENPSRYAFSLEMAFLADRYHQLQHYTAQELFHNVTVADYSIYKTLVFAQHNLSGQELLLYKNLYDIIARSLKQPDLIIYLNRPVQTLLKHIKERNRPYEQGISQQYLMNIQTNYVELFMQNSQVKVVVIDADKFDFLGNTSDFQALESLIFQNHPPGLNFHE